MFRFKKFFIWLNEMSRLTPHTSNYHNEDLYTHVIHVAYQAAENNASKELFIAACLHDVGKPETFVNRPNKGATFYGHEDHITLVKEFLTEDDENYKVVCDYIKYHMLPFNLKSPSPWKEEAEKKLLNVIHSKDSKFMSNLFALNDFDKNASFKVPPSEEFKKEMYDVIIKYAVKLNLI